MEEKRLEYLSEEAALDLIREVIRNQQHQEPIENFLSRVAQAVFSLDKKLATSRRLRTSA